jgi:hypothetical protein
MSGVRVALRLTVYCYCEVECKRKGEKGRGSIDEGSNLVLGLSSWRRRRGSDYSVRESLWCEEGSEEFSGTFAGELVMRRWWVWVGDIRLGSPGV